MKNDKSFKSIFKTEFEEILKMKHEQGYKYITQEGDLHMLDNYIHSLGMNEKVLTRDICENWCRKRQNESQGTRRKRVTAIRELVKCLSRKGIHTDSMAGIKVKKSPKYPYLYELDETTEVAVLDYNDEDVRFVDGHPVESLELQLKWMIKQNRPKDQEKIKIIKNFLKNNRDMSKANRQGY